MELISIGFLAGAIFAVIVCGAGIIYGRHDKGQYDIDTDVRVYVPMRCRRGGGNNRHDKPLEIDDITNVLQNLALSCTGYERKCIDAAIKIIDKLQDLLTEAENDK